MLLIFVLSTIVNSYILGCPTILRTTPSHFFQCSKTFVTLQLLFVRLWILSLTYLSKDSIFTIKPRSRISSYEEFAVVGVRWTIMWYTNQARLTVVVFVRVCIILKYISVYRSTTATIPNCNITTLLTCENYDRACLTGNIQNCARSVRCATTIVNQGLVYLA